MANWKGVNYSDNDVLTMQQEAIRRVRQMQQRSAQNLSAQEQALQPPQSGPRDANPLHTQQPPHASQPASSPAWEGAAAHMGTGRPAQPRPSGFGTQAQGGSAASLFSQLGSNLGHLGSNLSLSGIAEKLGLGGKAQEGEESKKGLSNIISSLVGEDTAIGKVFAALNIDNERLILIGLLLILMNEKADLTLLIALFYLLL